MAGWGETRSWWGVAVGLVLLALWTVRPLGIDAPRMLETAFDADHAVARLAAILGDERAHPTDSDANDAVEARLLTSIRQAGFVPEVRDRFHCNDIREGAAICARPRNIAFWVTPPGDDAVMIAAHYDSVPAGPGAADDGVGVAVALEVAYQLEGRRLARPVLVLLTDAEEAGLVGAAAFAAHDPLAKRIGAVVNMEARGTTGGVNMFQTSSPNARDVAAIEGGPLPSANSLATDFYELLPNDTDLTMLLPLGVDAGNYSIIGGGKRYHTPLDNLAHLDRDSVRHMGATTLAAVTGFAAGRPQGTEGRRVYTDLGRRLFLVMPQIAAAAILALGLAASLLLFWRVGAEKRLRSAFGPLLAVVAGTGLAFGASAAVAALRPEAAFGTAHPAVFRLLYASAALAGASLIVALIREESRVRGTAAAWFWLGIPILAFFAFVPGLAILATWPMLFVIAAACASRIAVARRAVPFLVIGAALLFALIVLPLAGGLEDGLFVEHAAPASALLVFMFLFFMPGSGPRAWLMPAVCAIIAIGSLTAALLVPAYTQAAPRHLSVVHQDDNGKAAYLIEDNGPLPPAMRAVAAFEAEPGSKGNWRAAAPKLGDDGKVTIEAGRVAGGHRTVRLVAESPLADRQEFLIKHGKAIRKIVVNGAHPKVKGVPTYIGCTGRSCRRLVIELELSTQAKLPEISWRRTRYGAGEAAQRLVASRPVTAQPVHVGDRQVLIRPLRLPPPPAGDGSSGSRRGQAS